MTIKYIEIENFKTFADKVHIDLTHPAVLIGPNNAGKTSVIQALSLWSRGIKAWFEKKGEPRSKERRERISAGLNRLNIVDVPVSETRFFWNATRVRKANTPIELKINLGIEQQGITRDCRLIFTYSNPEVIYCKPCPETTDNDEVLRIAAQLDFHLLYPMSGIMSGVSADTEESLLPEGRIDVLLGQGQTAQVLRNLCYKVIENDKKNNHTDWLEICNLIKKLFLVELNPPIFNETRGILVMDYKQPSVDKNLDISLAGRGLQQVLLILAYLYGHKKSILLVDEPDAHLEILRQRQIYEILKDTAEKNGSQVVIATHSEVILEDAVDTNLSFLLNGTAVNLAKKQDMKNALRSFGIEHYYNAKIKPSILYVEGSTDIEMLRALAQKLKHPAAAILDDRLNCYYTQNIASEDSLDNRLERASGAYLNYKAHYHTLKNFVPELKAIALFDGDGLDKKDEINETLAILYWKNYELENYFISPQVLMNFAKNYFSKEYSAEPLFESSYLHTFQEIMNNILLDMVFSDDESQLAEFNQASLALQRTLLKNIKMSLLTEKVFQQFAQKTQQPLLLNKGQFYQLVSYADLNETKELKEKLDLLVNYLQ